MFERIVLAVDGSEPSKRAVAAAAELGQRFDAPVTVIHASGA